MKRGISCCTYISVTLCVFPAFVLSVCVCAVQGDDRVNGKTMKLHCNRNALNNLKWSWTQIKPYVVKV